MNIQVEVVKAFRDSKGQIHNTKVEAMQAEFKISVQSFFNRNGVPIHSNGKDTYSPGEISSAIGKHTDEFEELISDYRKSMNRCVGQSRKHAIKNAAKAIILKDLSEIPVPVA